MTSMSYDEDLEENAFLKSFKINQKVLFENSLKKGWIIAVPRQGSFVKPNFNDMDYLNHVLVPVSENNTGKEKIYKTLGNQKIGIRGKSITIYSKESDELREIKILFSETFYSDNDVAYEVICINNSITSTSDNDTNNNFSKVFSLNSVEECSNFLWKFVAKYSTKTKIDKLISLTKSDIQTLDPVNIDSCFLHMRNLYVASYNIITSQKIFIKVSSKNENIQNSLKLALEMYLCHQLNSTLFCALTDVTAEKDEEINKATRRYQYICASKSGIRFDVCENIPRAKKELNSLRWITTPVGICECIRKVVAELSSLRQGSVSFPTITNGHESLDISTNNKEESSASLRSSLMVTSDDLLSALIFLIIKSDNPNWFTFLEFGVKFRFASCSRDDEYQYYLTTLEAALEHIRSMCDNSNIEYEDNFIDTTINYEDGVVYDDRPSNHWTRAMDNSLVTSRLGTTAAYQMNQTRHLFKLIQSGQTSAVMEQLQRTLRIAHPNISTDQIRRTVGPSNFLLTESVKEENNGIHHCHPLCSCKTKKLPGKNSTQSLIEGFRRKSEIQPIQGSHTFDISQTTERKFNDNGSSFTSSSNSFGRTLSLTSCDDRGWNALHVAAWYGKLDIVQMLLKYGVEPDYTSLEGDTPLHLASKQGHQDILFHLLDIGADASIRNGAGNTPLHIATEFGYYSCVSSLAYYGNLMQANSIDLNSVNSSGNTALHIAAMWGYENIVNCLIENGVSAIIKNSKDLLPHEVASTKKLIRLIKIKALQQEKKLSHETNVQSVINKSILDNSDPNSKGLTKKDINKQKQTIEIWSDPKRTRPSMINVRSATNTVPIDNLDRKIEKLLKVVADGDLEMLKFLLEITDDYCTEYESIDYSSSANIDKKLCHPLCQCAKCSPVQKVIIKTNNQLLNINSTNREGFHCLHIAAIHDRSTIAKFILQHGANPTCVTSKLHLFPLHLAAIYSSIKVLCLLLYQKTVDINCLDKKSNTPLFYASSKGKYDSTDLLIKGGANVNMQNHRGNTALHEAIRYNHTEIVQLLIDNGAKIDLENNQGLTPLDLAKDLKLYCHLKKLNQLNQNINQTPNEKDSTNLPEHTVVAITGSWSKDNENDDSISVYSENSVMSLNSQVEHDSIIPSEPLFAPEDNEKLQQDVYSLITQGPNQISTNQVNEIIDHSLLERIDHNSRYNYHLMFKDPHSPSLSSTNSS